MSSSTIPQDWNTYLQNLGLRLNALDDLLVTRDELLEFERETIDEIIANYVKTIAAMMLNEEFGVSIEIQIQILKQNSKTRTALKVRGLSLVVFDGIISERLNSLNKRSQSISG